MPVPRLTDSERETALAALPDPGTKERSWQVLAGGTATNAQVRAIGGELWQRRQADLMRPYASRYVELVPRLWEDLSPALAGSLTLQLFPSTLVEPEVLAMVDDLLGRTDLHPGLRRVVLEQEDDLRRAWKAQQAAGAA